jgi:bis(5'-nucleosyl)-tetraphosphatase (symmetrical)
MGTRRANPVGNSMQHLFIGDVQGCADELDLLTDRARREFGESYELWCVGDLINRGPANLRVLRHMRDQVESGRARLVLGNHEIGLLLTAAGLRQAGPQDTYTEVLASPDAEQWLHWLRERPLLESGRLGDTPFAMVHAAVNPAWTLGEARDRARRVEARLRDPDFRNVREFLATKPEDDSDRRDLEWFTRCRSVDAKGRCYAAPPDENRVAWHAAWSRSQSDYAVVYGHWALQGLHVAPRLRGLDTGCVHHGRGIEGALTAWLPTPEDCAPFSGEDSRFWRVPAQRIYLGDP